MFDIIQRNIGQLVFCKTEPTRRSTSDNLLECGLLACVLHAPRASPVASACHGRADMLTCRAPRFSTGGLWDFSRCPDSGASTFCSSPVSCIMCISWFLLRVQGTAAHAVIRLSPTKSNQIRPKKVLAPRSRSPPVRNLRSEICNLKSSVRCSRFRVRGGVRCPQRAAFPLPEGRASRAQTRDYQLSTINYQLSSVPLPGLVGRPGWGNQINLNQGKSSRQKQRHMTNPASPA